MLESRQSSDVAAVREHYDRISVGPTRGAMAYGMLAAKKPLNS